MEKSLLSLLSVIDSIKFHSSDYLDALEMGMKPQEGSRGKSILGMSNNCRIYE